MIHLRKRARFVSALEPILAAKLSRSPRQTDVGAVVELLEERRLFGFHFWNLSGGTGYYNFGGGTSDNFTSPTAGSGVVQNGTTAGDPVILSSGTLSLNTTDLQSNGFGSAWGISRSWTNNPGMGSNDHVGLGWNINQESFIAAPPSGSIDLNVVLSGASGSWFRNVGTTGSPSYKAWYGGLDTLLYNPTSDQYTVTDTSGNQTNFYGFNNSSYGTFAGTFASYKPTSGSTINVVSHNSSTGAITEEQRSEIVGSTNVTESLLFTYLSSGNANAGELENVKLRRTTDGGTTWTIVRQVEYSYYGDGTGDSSYGSTNDLRTAAVQDASGQVLAEDYYRYNAANLLYQEFTPTDFARLQANVSGGTTPFTAADPSAFATLKLTYANLTPLAIGLPTSSDSQTIYTNPIYRVSGEVVNGDGSTDSGGTGAGSYNFSYNTYSVPTALDPTSSTGDATEYQDVAYQTVVNQPNGRTDTYFFNFAGQTLLTDKSDGTNHRLSYNKYDAHGYLTYAAAAAAVSSYSLSGTTLTATLNSTSGRIDTWVYPGATSATNVSAGTAIGYMSEHDIQQGSSGSHDELESYDYKSQTVGTTTVYYLADDTRYRDAFSNTSGETTSYRYNYTSGTFSPTQLVTTLPAISTSENGPNSLTADTKIYSADGSVIWEKDPDGHLAYTAYNISTGAISENIQDVTTDDSSYYSGTTPFTVPGSDASLILVTAYATDVLGRTIQKTSPNGNITYTVYDDVNHETRVYPGWHNDSSTSMYTTTGPVQVAHDDWSLGYSESFTYAYTPVSGVTAPAGTDTITSVQSLTRSIANTSGQLIEQDTYSSLSGVSYNASPAYLGALNTNYYATLYAYDSGGNRDRVQSAVGTITRTVIDEFNQPVSTWTGAIIGGTASDAVSGTWSASNAGNMVEVSASSYDVDGNITEVATYPSGAANSSNGRATEMYYDYRDRLVAKMDGAVEVSNILTGSAHADTAAKDTFVTYYSLDNLGEVTQQETYNAEEQPITFDGGSTNSPSATGAWRFIGSAGVAYAAFNGASYADGIGPADGVQVAYLQYHGAISQTANFNAGSYTFSFESAQKRYYNYGVAVIKVFVDGISVATVTPASNTAYETDTINFSVTTTGPHTITLQDTTIGVALIDHVQLYNASGTAYSAPALADPGFESTVLTTWAQAQPPVPTANMKLESESIFSYDDQGRVFSSSKLTVDPITGADENTSGWPTYLTTNSYHDADGNLLASIAPTGAATKYVYNGAGWNTAVYKTDGGNINYFSDVAIGASNAYPIAGSVIGDVVLSQSQYIYDGDGNVIETISKDRLRSEANSATGTLGNATTSPAARVSYQASFYDAADRATAEVNVGTNGGSSWTGPTTLANAPSGSLVTRYVYDSAGRLAFSTDPLGLVTADGYDMLGRTTVTVGDWTSTLVGPLAGGSLPTPTDSTNQTTKYTYDGDSHMLTMTAVMPSGETSQVTHYLYGINTSQGSVVNSNDVLYKVQYPDPSSGTNTSAGTYSQAETYTFDAAGEAMTTTDRNGNVHAYTYDSLGRVTSDQINSFGSGVDQTVKKIGYAYNDAGQMSGVTSYNSGGGIVNQVQETYDGFGRLASEAQAHAGNVSGGTPTVTYTHDAAKGDRLSSIAYPNGRTINYNYSGGSGLDSVVSRISSIGDSGGTLQSYGYLGLNDLIQSTDGNGIVLNIGLDTFNRVSDQKYSNSSGGTIDEFQYGYDADGNVLYKNNMVLTSQSEVYTYDGLNRLASFQRGTLNISGGTATIAGTAGTTQGWSYDALGNWNSSTLNGVTTSRTNSAQNQVNTIGTAALGYDANGNMLTDQTGQQYVYDGWNRQVTVKNSSGTAIASYTYDALGRRVTETHSGTTTDLYYSNRGQVIEEQISGSMNAQYVWSPFYENSMVERDKYASFTSGDAVGYGLLRFYVEQDANYNVTSLTDPYGNVVELYQYDPYGNVTVLNGGGSVLGSGTIASSGYSWTYFGQGLRMDAATGTVDNHGRVYLPSIGRSVQEDPAGFINGPNRYQREISNPVSGLDPSGFCRQVVSTAPELGPFGPTGPGIFQMSPSPITGPISLTGHTAPVTLSPSNLDGQMISMKSNDLGIPAYFGDAVILMDDGPVFYQMPPTPPPTPGKGPVWAILTVGATLATDGADLPFLPLVEASGEVTDAGLAAAAAADDAALAAAENAATVSPTLEDAGTLFRRGNFADPATGWEGNYVKGLDWSQENPLTTPNYANDLGLPAGNSSPMPDWVVGGQINPGAGSVSFGPASGIGGNLGGAPEFSLSPNDVTLEWFHMP